MVKSYVNRVSKESEEKLTIAWLTAYFYRVKKMPELKKLLEGEKKEQTSEEMLEKIKELNAKLGGKIEVRNNGGS